MSEILDDQFMGTKPTGEFEFFRDFFNQEQATAFSELLDAHEVPHKIEPIKTLLDNTITGTGLMPHSILKLRTKDFTKVNQLLADKALADKAFVEGHYFQEYTAAELLEVVQKPDEWNAEDIAVAKHLLEVQGIPIAQDKLQSIEDERRKSFELGKPFNLGTGLFYITAVILTSLLFNHLFWVGGIGLGWYYWMDKSVYVDGKRYFTYDPKGRNIGKVIFFMACLALILSFLAPIGIDFLF
ncbi:MAG: hypothetical protein IPN76_23850 [Saprospiraceae bacterium]|nr:hypothetical protein [Saprospiraceae bacterium]